jgi:hypothetical protein
MRHIRLDHKPFYPAKQFSDAEINLPLAQQHYITYAENGISGESEK